MNNSRRNFLKITGVVVLGVIAFKLPSIISEHKDNKGEINFSMNVTATPNKKDIKELI
jgi:hypothetical protein